MMRARKGAISYVGQAVVGKMEPGLGLPNAASVCSSRTEC
jgi:hypothetical protein